MAFWLLFEGHHLLQKEQSWQEPHVSLLPVNLAMVLQVSWFLNFQPNVTKFGTRSSRTVSASLSNISVSGEGSARQGKVRWNELLRIDTCAGKVRWNELLRIDTCAALLCRVIGDRGVYSTMVRLNYTAVLTALFPLSCLNQCLVTFYACSCQWQFHYKSCFCYVFYCHVIVLVNALQHHTSFLLIPCYIIQLSWWVSRYIMQQR